MNKLLKSPVVLRWIGGIFCLLWFLIFLSKNIISSLGFGLAAILLLPPLTNLLTQLLKKPVSRLAKILLLVVFLFIGFSSAPKYESNQEAKIVISPIITFIPTTAPEVKGVETSEPTPEPKTYRVVRVVDGDTIEVDIDGKEERVRLIGIDTPEIVDPRKTVECFGIEASNKAKELLLNKNVVLEADPTQGERDKYNRLLRYVFLDEGINVNKYMISEGYAHEYTYQLPYKFQEEFKQAEKEARENKKGLWADNACITPTVKQIIPSNTPIQKFPTSTPGQQQIYNPPNPTSPPQNQNTGGYSCNCSKTCTQITTCEEAYYQLNNCGCAVRDGDDDGVPCENLCQ